MFRLTPLEVASGSSGCESRQSNFTAESEGQAYAGPDALQKADEANRDHLCLYYSPERGPNKTPERGPEQRQAFRLTPLEVASGSSGCESRQSNFTAESEGQAYAPRSGSDR
jgi:hypothetical protein